MIQTPWQETADGLSLVVRLTPKGGRDELDGIGEGPDGAVLKARVRAAPTDGQANRAIVKLIAKSLGVPKRAVQLTAGQKSRIKNFHIDGDPAALSAQMHALVLTGD